MDLNAVCVISYVSLTEGLFRLTGIFMKGIAQFFINLGCGSPVS